ncbi:protein translocase subunit SecD [Luedemannella flava]|uniref:Protein translocase subunit SecD n=2 Tax=Luedemannella flava TaxID=349316 RepID=A0ABP4Z6Y8_9ACTN
MRPSRYLIVLTLIFVALFTGVYFAGDGSLSKRLKPRLGLDLVGGTTVTLTAQIEGGGAPKADQMEEARRIIESRVNGLGVSEAEVVIEGDNHIVISVAGENRDDVKSVGTPAQLRFRKVLNSVADTSASVDATASASATPQASGSASASATPQASATTPAATTPAATPSASASPTAEPVTGTKAERLAAVQKKLGAAFTAAQGVTDPTTAGSDPTLKAALAPFSKLSADEVGALPAEMQFNVPQISCAQLNGRKPGSIDAAKETVVSCDESGAYKYLLDQAKVLGTDVSDASANIEQKTGQWVVDLKFKSSGQDKWTALTKEAYNNADSKCAQGAVDENGRCAVAVVLDNKTVSAPSIQNVITGDATISGGSIDQKGAKQLANQLRYGALPLTFEQSEANTVTATLGAEYLKAGLLAMGIGMALVIVYAFFYYRLLGSVIFLSLVLSGLLTYGALILLGHTMGFTVTLAGIAGFIVSLGVAADSFVIYFERLKDEIREGRSPRSAVGRAWIRARRTIITANVVSILAAATLYIFGVGSVQGFAFALGLATALDLLIVFLFRHPIMTMLASTPAFLSPRVSGLGRVLHHADEAPATPTTRVKEA